MSGASDIREVVREKYGAVARESRESTGCCGGESSCGCAGDNSVAIGYLEDQLASIPKAANLGLGCGNPLAHAAVRRGETVLDLGSGAGIDAFLAASEVGPEGHVIGVDMTSAMILRARENAAKGGYANVEFRLGEIETLPVADASVDLIISNCVINLSPDKPRVFREAWRALRPGGRMVVSDLVLSRALPDPVRASVEAYVGCVAGAWLKDDYLRAIADAGFESIEIVEQTTYGPGAKVLPGIVSEAGAWDAVLSIKVRARKPAT